jgi:hypothetical protein
MSGSWTSLFTGSVMPKWWCRFDGIGCNRSMPFAESRFSRDYNDNWTREI